MTRDVEVLLVNGLRHSQATRRLAARVNQGSKLEVVVPFTDASGTLAALSLAAQLGRNLDARINLVALQTVPYGLELTRPPIALEWLEERLRDLALRSPIDIHVDIILSRDGKWALRQMLKPHSLVVIGGRRRWWRTKEQRLAETLRHDGHRVISACLQ